MNELLFNALFDRRNDNPDFLRGRVASCVKFISEEMTKNSKENYIKTFYEATIKYNSVIVKEFGLGFLASTLEEIYDFKNTLFEIYNSQNLSTSLSKIEYSNYLVNFSKLVTFIGYTKRSRILRRYYNFISVSNNFLNKKIEADEYQKELLNHILFFNEMLKNFENIKINDICIYYFVYDIRASENVRKIKLQMDRKNQTRNLV